MGLPLNLNLPASPELVRIDPQVYHLTLSYLICNAIGRTTRECIGALLRKLSPWAVQKVNDTCMSIP